MIADIQLAAAALAGFALYAAVYLLGSAFVDRQRRGGRRR